jgi:hypothetical protein
VWAQVADLRRGGAAGGDARAAGLRGGRGAARARARLRAHAVAHLSRQRLPAPRRPRQAARGPRHRQYSHSLLPGKDC